MSRNPQASGSLSFSQRLALSRNYPNSLVNHGVLRRPPSGYHYETRRHILKTYPRNSYTIKYGPSHIARSNNNYGGSTPSKGGKARKKNKKKKSDDDEDPGDTSSPANNSPPPAEPAGSPADETPPAEAPPPPAK
ncbi:uncharacterized protein LOC111034943 [Myzus persicae]|uniref:uncharacterized protein LOC111034943 n=1 Tax=Myzus persicae TaxID=13164 RepID=UPI000B937348|nr:uncharacterized protein LOC111034943 [Myzus persicae]